MESVTILRALLRRRLLFGLGVLLAIAVGVLGAYSVSLSPPGMKSKTVTAGFASQRVLVDTPTSLVADARAKGATSIVIRATILADQVESAAMRREIAKAVGISSAELGAISSTTASAQTESPLAKQVLEVTRPIQPYLVSVGLQAGQPILAIQTAAPSAAAAARLARAATVALAAAGRRGEPARGLVRVERLGTAQVGVRQAGGGKKKAAMAALVVLVFWCAALVAADGIRRRRRLPEGASFPSGISLPR
jgi:hypothetical protein